MKKKLLVFHIAVAPYRVDFFNRLNKMFDARICFLFQSIYSNIKKQLGFTPIFINRSDGVLRWIKCIVFQIRSFKPDVVVCSEFNLATLAVVLLKILTFKKYRIISMVDDSYNMIADGNSFSRKHIWATRILMPFIDNVVNVEPRVVEFFQKKYGKGVYMPIIVDENNARKRLQRILPISQEYVKKYNLEGKMVLLFVGRFVGLKNIPFAIDAFLKANVKNSVFVIVGDGPEKENIQRMVQNRNEVIFTGRLEGDDLYAWYNIAQVFTLQSTREAFGAVTNEALLGGCYCLVSNLAGSNCLIEENVNGNIIDPYDAVKYVELLKTAFDKVKPISLPLSLKDNLMIEKFDNCFENMIKKLME